MKMHGCLTAFLIQLDVMTELRILEPQLVLESAFFQILRPEQLLVDSSMLQLSMDPLKIRQIAVRLRDFWRFGEHLGKDVVGLLIWQRPAEPRSLANRRIRFTVFLDEPTLQAIFSWLSCFAANRRMHGSLV